MDQSLDSIFLFYRVKSNRKFSQLAQIATNQRSPFLLNLIESRSIWVLLSQFLAYHCKWPHNSAPYFRCIILYNTFKFCISSLHLLLYILISAKISSLIQSLIFLLHDPHHQAFFQVCTQSMLNLTIIPSSSHIPLISSFRRRVFCFNVGWGWSVGLVGRCTRLRKCENTLQM